MERNKFFGIVILTMMLIFSFSGLKLNAQEKGDKKEYLKLEVNGLACPFCAYGLEKNYATILKVWKIWISTLKKVL